MSPQVTNIFRISSFRFFYFHINPEKKKSFQSKVIQYFLFLYFVKHPILKMIYRFHSTFVKLFKHCLIKKNIFLPNFSWYFLLIRARNLSISVFSTFLLQTHLVSDAMTSTKPFFRAEIQDFF